MRGDGEGTTTTIVVAGTMATKAVVVEMAGVGHTNFRTYAQSPRLFDPKIRSVLQSKQRLQ